MNIILIIGITLVGLFILEFLTKRRFGLLGLALAGGSVLADQWSNVTLQLLESHKLVTGTPFWAAIVQMALVLLPSILLLLHGPTYKKPFGRIFGAAGYALLAAAFLVTPLSRVLDTSEGLAGQSYAWLTTNSALIIGIGVSLAVLDLFFSGMKRHHASKPAS